MMTFRGKKTTKRKHKVYQVKKPHNDKCDKNLVNICKNIVKHKTMRSFLIKKVFFFSCSLIMQDNLLDNNHTAPQHLCSYISWTGLKFYVFISYFLKFRIFIYSIIMCLTCLLTITFKNDENHTISSSFYDKTTDQHP